MRSPAYSREKMLFDLINPNQQLWGPNIKFSIHGPSWSNCVTEQGPIPQFMKPSKYTLKTHHLPHFRMFIMMLLIQNSHIRFEIIHNFTYISSWNRKLMWNKDKQILKRNNTSTEQIINRKDRTEDKCNAWMHYRDVF